MTGQTQLNWNSTNLDNIQTAWEGDLWDRKGLGIQLTHYVDRLNCGAVLALDARWGEGKTWFVRNWQKHLEDENHHVIYLDAFANDYLDDPFLVITSEITNVLSKDKKTKRKVKKLIDLSASVGTALLPSLPKIALTLGLHLVGAGFLGGIFQNSYENAQNEIDKLSDETSDRIKESIQEKIAGHEAEKKTLEEFKKHLAQTVENLDKPLVFIIDELDRCRPDFAIRLIERIKHFFDIPKIVFFLVMDKTQLSKVVCHNYGYDETVGEEYLDKFIDFWVSLPAIMKLSIGTNREYLFKLKELLHNVGEDSLDVCLILFFAQNDHDFSTRILKKRINQYALLRTDSVKINIFLMLSIISGAENLLKKIENIAQKIYQIDNRYDLITLQNLSNVELDYMKKLINKKFEIEAKEYIALLEQVGNIHSKYSNVVQPDPKPKIDKELTQLYCEYSLNPLDNYLDISNQFALYLKANLWKEEVD